MSGPRTDIPDPAPKETGVQDDFHAESPAEGDERRLHLLAFDYWLSLKGDQGFPLFKALTHDGLAPFRNNCMLLELTASGAVVRFVGEHVSMLIDAPVQKGTDLSAFPDSMFAGALLEQFSSEEGRAKAAEFEFVEDLLDCRGIILPFSHTGDAPHFAMVVANFRRRKDLPQAKAYSLEEAAAACQRAAKDVAHLDNGSRGNLYHALASALAFYEEAERHPDAYAERLKAEGLKVQARAPFTPALKLTFGKDYDKTRLTEYAAALAYARRMGENAETLAGFLENEPGGIKGCVRRERAARRGEEGSAAARRQDDAAAILRAAPVAALDALSSDTEFCLVIARRADGGGLEVVDLADVGQNTVDAAVRRHADKIK